MCAALLSKVSPTEWLGRLWINLLKLRWWVAGLFWKGRICFPGPIYCDRTWDLFLGVHIMHLHQTFLYLLEPPEVMLCIRCSLVLYNLRDNVKVRFNFDVTNIKSHSHMEKQLKEDSVSTSYQKLLQFKRVSWYWNNFWEFHCCVVITESVNAECIFFGLQFLLMSWSQTIKSRRGDTGMK